MVHPLLHAQLQVQGPLPLTLEAIPELHKFVVGLLENVHHFEVQQTQLIFGVNGGSGGVPPQATRTFVIYVGSS